MSETSRAGQVLSLVLKDLPMWDQTEFAVRVELSWTDGDSVLCLVYRQPGMYPGLTLGLRRTVEENWSIEDVVEEVLVGEIGEPLGSLYDALHPDADGVMWWTGNLPEWKQPR